MQRGAPSLSIAIVRDQAVLLTCRACGEQIGFYERFRWQMPDGRLLSPRPPPHDRETPNWSNRAPFDPRHRIADCLRATPRRGAPTRGHPSASAVRFAARRSAGRGLARLQRSLRRAQYPLVMTASPPYSSHATSHDLGRASADAARGRGPSQTRAPLCRPPPKPPEPDGRVRRAPPRFTPRNAVGYRAARRHPEYRQIAPGRACLCAELARGRREPPRAVATRPRLRSP
jgi:hypothetical protein